MTNFIETVREAQLNLVRRFFGSPVGVALHKRRGIKLREEIMKLCGSVIEDEVGRRAYAELRYDVITAIVGYTDWLATKLWRDYQSTNPMTLVLDNRAREQIVVRHQCNRKVLDTVIEFIATSGERLPVIGYVGPNIVIDREALTHWASYFDWT